MSTELFIHYSQNKFVVMQKIAYHYNLYYFWKFHCNFYCKQMRYTLVIDYKCHIFETISVA